MSHVFQSKNKIPKTVLNMTIKIFNAENMIRMGKTLRIQLKLGFKW
jgi:hypothetical protein